MNEKEYEPIDPQDLKDFALLDIHNQPKTGKAKVILLRDASFLETTGGFLLQSCFTRPEYRKYFTPAECQQLIYILVSNMEDHE